MGTLDNLATVGVVVSVTWDLLEVFEWHSCTLNRLLHTNVQGCKCDNVSKKGNAF